VVDAAVLVELGKRGWLERFFAVEVSFRLLPEGGGTWRSPSLVGDDSDWLGYAWQVRTIVATHGLT